MSIHRSRLDGRCVRAASICVVAVAAGSGAAYADMTPTTGVDVQATAATTGGVLQDQQNFTNPNTSSSASVSRSVAGGDGSTAGASASAFADFGTLGVSGSGGGSTPPANPRTGASGSTLASAFWDDFLTAMPNPDSLLVPGTPVTATLTMDLHFDNSLLALNNGTGFFSYEIFAGLVPIDPVTGARSNAITVLDDCLVVDPDHRDCTVGSRLVDIGANTGDQALTIQFAPVALPIAILQPFELGVGLVFDGECNIGPNDTAVSSCSYSGDALHTSIATLQPLGNFTLVAASGHDYAPVVTPPASAPEPGTLALIACGLVPLALSLRRRGGRRDDGRAGADRSG